MQMPIRPPLHRPPAWQTAAQRRQAEQGSPSQNGRYDRRWQRLRLVILARDPLCVFCLRDGRIAPSAVVDHIKPIAERPDLRLDPDNLRGLCAPCHNRHTATSQHR